MKENPSVRMVAMLIAVCLMGLIYWLSSISDLSFFHDTKLPELLAWFINTFRLQWGMGGYFSYGFSFHPDNLIHKAGHIVLYGLLGVSLFVAFGRSWRWALLVATLFAFSDEWHQSMVPGRDGRFFDVILDVAASWGFIWMFDRVLTKYMERFAER